MNNDQSQLENVMHNLVEPLIENGEFPVEKIDPVEHKKKFDRIEADQFWGNEKLEQEKKRTAESNNELRKLLNKRKLSPGLKWAFSTILHLKTTT